MRVKICGTTSVHDARLAEEAGADFLGVIVAHPPSPRNIDLALAREIRDAVNIPIVAVTVNLSLSQLLQINEVLTPHALQLHGDESPALIEELAKRGLKIWAAVGGQEARERASTLASCGVEAILVDARSTSETGKTIYGGTGLRSDWELARALVEAGSRVILSGGLSPANVGEAIAIVQPWMVDVVSGVEATPGLKDPEKLRRFITVAKANS